MMRPPIIIPEWGNWLIWQYVVLMVNSDRIEANNLFLAHDVVIRNPKTCVRLELATFMLTFLLDVCI